MTLTEYYNQTEITKRKTGEVILTKEDSKYFTIRQLNDIHVFLQGVEYIIPINGVGEDGLMWSTDNDGNKLRRSVFSLDLSIIPDFKYQLT